MLCPRTACKREIPDDSVFCCYCGKKIGPVERKTQNRSRGSGSVYKRGDTWSVELRTIKGYKVISRTTKGGFKSRAEAVVYIDELKSGKIKQEQMTISEAWELLKKTQRYQELSKDKISSYNTAYKRLQLVYFRTIGEIPFTELQKLVNDAPGAYYPKRDIKTVLGKLYEIAVKNECLDVSQDKTDLLELPKQPKSKKDSFTLDEVHKIWEAYQKGDKMAGFALILCYTGMRPGELLQLKLENIDLKGQRIIGGIKTEAGIDREIPIAKAIIPIIQEAMKNAKYGLADSCREHFYDEWKSENWGIERHMTANAGRHTLASAMEEAKISVMVRKKILGHKIDDITERYTTITFKQKLSAVEKATAKFKPKNNVGTCVGTSSKKTSQETNNFA